MLEHLRRLPLLLSSKTSETIQSVSEREKEDVPVRLVKVG